MVYPRANHHGHEWVPRLEHDHPDYEIQEELDYDSCWWEYEGPESVDQYEREDQWWDAMFEHDDYMLGIIWQGEEVEEFQRQCDRLLSVFQQLLAMRRGYP